ncbi:MAG: hypothetical protein WCC74_03215 [Minisyncoccia bacterium]
MISLELLKIFLPSIMAFFIGIFSASILSDFLYKNKMWKKKAKTIALDGSGTPIFNQMHAERETNTPRMGGVLIWISIIVTTIIFWLLAHTFDFAGKIDFLSRSQTWIPIGVLLLGAIIGLVDDYLEIQGRGGNLAGGLSLRKRLLLVSIIAFFVSLWFYFKLSVSSIGMPFGFPNLELGWLFIPFFIIVMIAIYSGGVIDGIDGLSGGIFASIFSGYAVIAFIQNQIDISALCAVIVGGILAFLWFNIPPARFYMSETGSMSLTITLVVIAFMTDVVGDGHGVVALPIIALPLLITSASVIIQLLSKKFRGKKVFLVAPLHHHFEAIGWPASKVTMRYWIVGIIFTLFGVIFALL